MNDQLLNQIAKMLRAQLKGTGHIWWIGGYVYGQTSRDDLFIILYPADERLTEKVVRVYPHDFKKLPAFIPTEGIDAGDTDANPNKEQARKRGIYHDCPLFEIVTFDGRDTQMGKERRFGDVLRVTNVERKSTAQPVPARPTPNTTEVREGGGRKSPTPKPAEPTPAQPGLPNYRAMALDAKTADEFDYAAYMVLKNGLYTEVEHITKTRASLMANWSPGPRPNSAMLVALETYRNQRASMEGRGAPVREAHDQAKTDALNAYHRQFRSAAPPIQSEIPIPKETRYE
jgi:hypothetical protein